MTRHQLHIGRGVVISEENLSLIRVSASEDGQLKNIYTDKCLFDTSSTDEEFHDLIALRAVAGDQPNIRDAHKFFPLESFSNFTRRNSFVVGYPTFANAMDYDASHLKSQRAIIGCTIDPSFKSHASLFKKARLDTDKYALDGLSGGAVFSLVEVPSGYAMMMEGIILRGSGTEIYFVESAYLHTMLSSF